MNEFSVGQWVIIHDHAFDGALGFISSIDEQLERALVRIIKNRKGRVIGVKASYFFTAKEMTHADAERLDGCKYNLIDLALSTRDYEWLQQIQLLEEK